MCKEIMLQVTVRKDNLSIIYLIFITIDNFYKSLDDDETYINPNLHSEDQDNLEIPESRLFKYCDI